jgi:hypothetical protein
LFGSFEGHKALRPESRICAAPFALVDIYPSGAQEAWSPKGRRRTLACDYADLGRLIRNPVYVLRGIPLLRTSVNRAREKGRGKRPSTCTDLPEPAMPRASRAAHEVPRRGGSKVGGRLCQGRGGSGWSGASSAAISSKTIWPPLSPTSASLSSVAEAAIARSFSGRYACRAPQP